MHNVQYAFAHPLVDFKELPLVCVANVRSPNPSRTSVH